MNRLLHKTALITGAAKGIGAATARLMAQHGATVFLADILSDQVQQVASSINASGNTQSGHATAITLDVTSEASWQAAIRQITDDTGTDAEDISATNTNADGTGTTNTNADGTGTNTIGHLDILVNNAGYFLGKGLEEASLEEWRKLVDVNMTSVFLATRYCAPALRAAGALSKHGSAIINMSSIAGLVAAPNDPLYGMTKGGVTQFTKSTAISFASQGDRIRVNSVHPGVVNTDMGELAIAAQARRLGIANADQIRTLSAERHPLGRIANTDDIANAILFLASDDAGFMTGVNMPVDGGYTAQ